VAVSATLNSSVLEKTFEITERGGTRSIRCKPNVRPNSVRGHATQTKRFRDRRHLNKDALQNIHRFALIFFVFESSSTTAAGKGALRTHAFRVD